MNPPVSNSFHNLLYAFLVILLFCPSIFQLPTSLSKDSAVFKNLNSFQLFPYSFVLTCSGLHQFIKFGPFLCRAEPEHLSAPNQNLSLVYPLFSLCHVLPCVAFRIFPFFVTHISVPYIFLASSLHRYLLVTAHHSVRCFASSLFLSMKFHFLLADA